VRATIFGSYYQTLTAFGLLLIKLTLNLTWIDSKVYCGNGVMFSRIAGVHGKQCKSERFIEFFLFAILAALHVTNPLFYLTFFN
jgi:hypothetical protein